MPNDQRLRRQLVDMLQGGHAHLTFDEAAGGFPFDRVGVRPPGLPHSGWELLEHLRFTQNDILRFSLSSDYKEPKWPDDYWPASIAPANPDEWDRSIQAFREDLIAFEALVLDPARDLYEPFPWGQGQNLLREAILIIDHNSYHLGQLVLVRRALGAWKG